MDGTGRLLTTKETVLEDKRNSPGGASEAVNNRKTVLEGPEKLLTTGATVLDVPGRMYHENQC